MKHTDGTHWKLYALIGLMTFVWSLNYIISKIALRELPPLFTAGLRTAIAGAMILPLYLWHRRHDWSRRDIPLLMALGVLGVALNQVFFVVGIARTSVAHASIMIGLCPVIVLLIASVMGLEKMTAGRLAGMVVALGGVALLQFAGRRTSGTSLTGDLLVLMASLAFAVFTANAKRVSHRFSTVTLNTFAYVAGGIVLLPVTIWQGRSVAIAEVSAAAWLSVLYMAAFSSVLSYLIYFTALQRIPASRASAFSYMQPVLATTMAIPLLGERPTASLIGGGLLVLLGVMLTERL